jgi:hypothetical protein
MLLSQTTIAPFIASELIARIQRAFAGVDHTRSHQLKILMVLPKSWLRNECAGETDTTGMPTYIPACVIIARTMLSSESTITGLLDRHPPVDERLAERFDRGVRFPIGNPAPAAA